MPLPDNRKLNIIFSLDKSCLGPKEDEPIEEFCLYAMKKIKLGSDDWINWSATPKTVSLAKEVSYHINGKTLLPAQATQYIERLGGNLKDLEMDFFSKTARLIDLFLRYKLKV